ncbi:MAG: Smr/MutS family protein [Thiotrichales bacterium]|nr:MAG: Smr/MutS family protein [Thiotrichales bacterium]
MNDDSDKDNQDDNELFRQAMQGVKPLKPDNRIRHRPAPKKPPRRQREQANPQDHGFVDSLYDQECPDRLYFERPGGAQKSVIKKLRNGKLPVDSTLDLHGLSVEQARQQLIAFMAECRASDYRHVIIVHGKGFRSQSKPVIKPMLNHWLKQSDEVLAFCSAQPKDGGSGAVYVLLRKAKDG